MSKLFVVVALVLAVANAAPGVPTAAQAKADLIAAGVSEDVATGVVAIATKYQSQFETTQSDPEAKKLVFVQFLAEVDSYIKDKPEADQTAYAAFVEKRKAEHKALQGTQ